MELYNEACANDGLDPKFSQDDIANTRAGSDPVRYPDEEYYNDTYLRDYAPFSRIVGEVSGGNEVADYYVNLGWYHENTFLKLGEGGKERINRLNLRSQLNYNITNDIQFNFNGHILFDLIRSPRYSEVVNNFWDLSSKLHPNLYPVLIPKSLVKDGDLLGAAKLVNNEYLLGGTSEYQFNIYGELTRNGYVNQNNRLFTLSTGLSFDLHNITPGLKASLNICFDRYNYFRTTLENEYAVYGLFYDADTVSSVSRYGQDVRQDNLDIGNVGYYRHDGAYATLDYNRAFSGGHSLKATALAYTYILDREGSQPQKDLHVGFRGSYSYKDKYFAELTGTLAFSGKLQGGDNSSAFSPGIGLGWVASEESFMEDVEFIDYLKARANWATISSDMGAGYYQYANLFRVDGSRESEYEYSYGGGSYSNDAMRLYMGNPALGWEKYTNANIGFESMMLDYKFGLNFTYFYIKSHDLITQVSNSLPAYYAGAPYRNYESNQVQGIEADLSYHVNIGDFKLDIGGNITYSTPKALIVDEIDYGEDEAYLQRAGKASDAIFGLVAEGFFEDDVDIANHAVQTFGTVKPGDIKYKDLNDDGRIDDLDRKIIGNSMLRLGYGINLSVEYKNLSLFALATGWSGGDAVFGSSYYWVDGDDKYSEEVLNRWTPETAETATYPRLTTASSTNNYRVSTFWIEENNALNLRTVQLNYTFPRINLAGLKEVLVYLRGSNLLEISKIKDKLELNIGSAPQTRNFSLGITANF